MLELKKKWVRLSCIPRFPFRNDLPTICTIKARANAQRLASSLSPCALGGNPFLISAPIRNPSWQLWLVLARSLVCVAHSPLLHWVRDNAGLLSCLAGLRAPAALRVAVPCLLLLLPQHQHAGKIRSRQEPRLVLQPLPATLCVLQVFSDLRALRADGSLRVQEVLDFL